ncbi:MAG: hypothetical protein ABT15_18330 [Pseudonocardia sp. SCN 73-27]|nr:hypothetical protein [Pseudonocardia sp. SCN 73-27]ODU15826.1 MAG: hypothetical protein ABS80_20730 [Pseudonocardia sp. SCN 72-51]ODV04959.1 MAG: hypothetical protein ABT15_18330 [Pseudonocardia sp. SCN 73-27]
MADMALSAQRAAGEHAEDLTDEPAGVRYERVDLTADAPLDADGVQFEDVSDAHPVRGVWAVPPAAPVDRAVLHPFGGGHVITSVDARRKFAGHLALAAGARVLLLDHPLAPSTSSRPMSRPPPPPTAGCSTRAFPRRAWRSPGSRRVAGSATRRPPRH